MRRAHRLLVFALMLPASLRGQRTLAPPERAMRDFLNAFAAGRHADAARFVDSTAFDRWRRAQLTEARRPRRPRRTVTADEIQRTDSSMPRAVAEYEARRVNASTGTADSTLLLHDFADVTSLESLARMPVREAVARYLRADDPRWMTESALRSMGCRIDSTLVAEIRRSVLPDTHAVLGAIVRDTLAYVVVQLVLRHPGEYGRDDDDDLVDPRVVRWRRTPRGWSLLDWDQWSPTGMAAAGADCRR